MDYIELARIEEFQNKRIKSLSVFGKKIGIIKRSDGSFYAIETGCKHQNADITQGTIIANVATCPLHEWKYDLETGECLNHDSPPLKKFPVKIEGNIIKVCLVLE